MGLRHSDETESVIVKKLKAIKNRPGIQEDFQKKKTSKKGMTKKNSKPAKKNLNTIPHQKEAGPTILAENRNEGTTQEQRAWIEGNRNDIPRGREKDAAIKRGDALDRKDWGAGNL